MRLHDTVGKHERNPVGKIAEKQSGILSAELTKTHSFSLFLAIFPTLGRPRSSRL